MTNSTKKIKIPKELIKISTDDFRMMFRLTGQKYSDLGRFMGYGREYVLKEMERKQFMSLKTMRAFIDFVGADIFPIIELYKIEKKKLSALREKHKKLRDANI